MSETKFTPGPWYARGFHIWQELHRDKKSRGRIADATLAWRGSEETDANARLLAAAPDLYAALALYVTNWEASGWTGHDQLIDAARAALAKARGE